MRNRGASRGNGLPTPIELRHLARFRCSRCFKSSKLCNQFGYAHAAGGRARLKQIGRLGVHLDVANFDVHPANPMISTAYCREVASGCLPQLRLRQALASRATFARVPPPPVRWASLQGPIEMAKGYWVSCYRSIANPDAVAAYAKLAGPALAAAGGKFLARGVPAHAYEAGIRERMVVVEFESVAAAVACHDSPAYQDALKVFNNAAERDFRIIEGLE